MMRRVLAMVLIQLLVVVPAEAHRLILFAKSEAGTIKGYGFFTGGGRAVASEVIFSDEAGKELHRLRTASDGSFAWMPGGPGRFHLVLNAGEGHIARASIAIGSPAGQREEGGRPTDVSGASALQASDLESRIERAVDRALERKVEPLREAIETLEARLRFKDLVAGIAAIIGMAGVAMWVLAWKARQ